MLKELFLRIIPACPMYSSIGDMLDYNDRFQAAEQAIVEGSADGKIYLGNAFSLQMVDDTAICSKQLVAPESIPANVISCIGHADTARIISGLLGREIPVNRTSIHLENGDVLYVAQVVGGRLPEGATTLPEGISIKFYKVVVVS